MPFVGIIAKESDSNFIKNNVLKNSIKTKFEFININRKNIENIKNIRFETLIINDDIKELIKVSKYLEDIIENAKNFIINSDIVWNVEEINNITKNKNIITYGLNQNATITISSVKMENILIYIQNKIIDITGKEIEEQEINIDMKKNNRKKVCNSMAIFSILAIYGEKLKKI